MDTTNFAGTRAHEFQTTLERFQVLVADDHAIVREGLRSLINSQSDMIVAGEAADGQAAVDSAEANQPDVAVLDISMPGLNGIEATERLKQVSPRTKVLILTVHEDKTYLRRVLAAGAAGYVLKRGAPSELVSAIRAVAAGGTYVDPTLASKLVDRLNQGWIPSNLLNTGGLSEREEEVLRLIAQGYSNKEVANQLDVSVKTVETYKARSTEKLDLQTRVDIVRFALSQGWLQ